MRAPSGAGGGTGQGAELPALSPRSFCWQHRPAQRLRTPQQGHSRCVICLEAVVRRPCFDTLVCPACTSAWFHRRCIQVGGIAPQHHPNLWGGGTWDLPTPLMPPLPQSQALSSALHHFRCPLCQDVQTFQEEMFRLGIKIPDRSASLSLPLSGSTMSPKPVPSCLPRVPLILPGLSCPRLPQGRCLGGGRGFRGALPAA